MVQTYVRRGGESLANSTTAGDQRYPSIGQLSSGGFVVAWADWSIGATRAQIYDAAGAKVGGEIVVNSFNSSLPERPGVTGLADGRFVVSWQNFNDPVDGDNYGVIAQIFDPAGNEVSGEFALSSATAGTQLHPDVASLPDGGFVASWVADNGGSLDIKAQRFDATGARVGSEITVNTTTANHQFAPSLSTFANGSFVVAWYDGASSVHTNHAVRAQRFGADGAKIGDELAHPIASSTWVDPAVAALAGGGFVLSWVRSAGFDVYAQVYDSAGAKVGGEFLVHTAATAGEQGWPTIAALPWGGFVISWHDYSQRADDLVGAVRAQLYDSAGVPVGGEFLVNTVTAGEQYFPDVAVLSSGSFVIGWTDTSGVGSATSRSGIKVQIFDPAAGPGDISLSQNSLDEAAVEGLAVARISSNSGSGSATYSIVADSTGGAFAIAGDELIVQDSAKLDYEAGTDVSITVRVTDVNGEHYDEVFALTLTDSRLEARYAAGGEFLANTTVAGDQSGPSVAAYAGGFVYTWTDNFEIRGQLFTASGAQAGGEFTVNTVTTNMQFSTAVAALDSGGFVVAWADSSQQSGDPHAFGIKAQRFDDGGAKIGGEFLVNIVTPGFQFMPSVAGLPGGGFVVSWTDESHVAEFGVGVRARLFDSAGAPLSGEIRVNTTTLFDQQDSSVAALANGGFVVTWTDASLLGGDSSYASVKAQIFDVLGHKVGGEVLVNTATDGNQARSSVAGLPSGGFVVTWNEDAGFGSNALVKAQLFDSTGAKSGSEIVVTAFSGESFGEPQVTALPWGGFAISWTDRSGAGEDNSGSAVRMQIFDALGGRVGDPFQVNETALRSQGPSSLAAAPDGTIAIGWTDFSGDGGGPASAGVRGRILDLPEQLAGTAGAELLVAGYGDDVGAGSGHDLLLLDLAAAPNGLTADFRTPGAGGVTIGGGATISGIETVWYLAGSEFSDMLYPTATAGAEGIPGVVYGRGGDDLIGLSSLGGSAYGGEGDDQLDGGSGTDRLYGGAGADFLSAAGGNDLLDGGSGADRMGGGTGDDVYVVDDAGDQLAEFAGGGTDEVRTTLAVFALPPASPTAEFENLTGLSGAGQALTGNSLDNRIRGGAGADSIDGGAGTDTVDYSGEAGGGAIVVNLRGAAVTSAVAIGAHQARDSYGGLDTLTSIENVRTGGGSDFVYGDGSANRIETGSGDDLLDGGAGADTLLGGLGNDIYYVDDAGDVVGENLGEGSDEVRTSLDSYSLLGTNIENLTATSNANRDFRGNSVNNVLTGGAGNDLLRLNDGGDDSAFGGAGNDVLYFGSAFTAADKADGGADRDVLILQGHYALTLGATNIAAIESISLQSGARTTWGDTANNFYDYAITMNDLNVGGGEQLIVNGQSLRADEDFVFDGSAESGDGKYLVYGGHGVDTFKGGAGNDVFFFEGARFGPDDTVDGGAGRDAIVISSGSGVNRFEFGDDALTSIESISLNNRFTSDPSQKPSYELVLGSGNVASGATLIVNGSSLSDRSQVVSVDGSAVEGNLILLGGFGDDILTGGAGADRLQGGEGIDVLTGGAGADTFRYASQYDATPQLPDRILDFVSGTDRIDLSAIDADVFAAGNQAFRWIGASAFAGTGAASAGELRAYEHNGNWFVEGDIDGNGAADLVIQLTAPVAPIVESDFLL